MPYRIVTAVLCCMLAVLTASACSDDEESPSPTPAAAPDAANATYLINGRQVTLAGGRSDEPAAPGSASRNVTALTPFTASDDIDGDGKPDTAVVLTNSPGGSGTFYYLAALSSAGSTPMKAVLLGDRISVSKLAINGNSVTVDYLTRPDSAPLVATPSVPISKTFTISGGEMKPN